MNQDQIEAFTEFRANESCETAEEKKYNRFYASVESKVGAAVAKQYEDELYGMFEALFSVEEVADEIQHLIQEGK